jgi:hypothetical protein
MQYVRTIKLQLYNTLIHPTVTYACETWVLKQNLINKLMTFERKIMRNIWSYYGNWRIKTNQEINEAIKGQNIIGFIKMQRLSWLGHVERMADDNNVKKIKRWKPCRKDQLEGLRHVGKMTFWEI